MIGQKMLKFIEDVHIPIRIACISESGYPMIVSLMYVYMDEKFFCATQGTSKLIKSLKTNSKCGFEKSLGLSSLSWRQRIWKSYYS